MKKPFALYLGIGIALEAVILALSFYGAENSGEAFKYAARYSGRLSALVFFISAYHYLSQLRLQKDFSVTSAWLRIFAILHLIHFGFLATNIYLNEIPIIPVRLAGGALAYLLIILAPFRFHAWRGWMQALYFFYVNLVVFLTYLARVQGKFPGAEPNDWHSFGLGLSGGFGLGIIVLFTLSLRNKR